MTNKRASADRRSHPRRTARVDVEAMLTHEGPELTKCRLQDIRSDGAFIETKNFALAKGAYVDVVPRNRRAGQFTHCRLSAEVVRVEEDGAALMFNSIDEQAYTILLEIVYPN